MKTNLILLAITLLSAGYLMSLFIRAILIPAWYEYKFQKKHKENEEKGLKPFFFENGTVTIYAKTQQGAIFQYKELKKQFKKK
jgi:hypothetical protein